MKTTRLGAVCAGILMVIGGAVQAAPISGQGTWETTLQGRDLDGDFSNGFEAYYDTVLDITWLADANYAYTSGYQQLYFGGMNWVTANAWAAALNPYGSDITGWRLPTTSPVDGSTVDDTNFSYIGTEDLGFNISAPDTLYAGSTASELAYLYHNTLGNKGYCDPTTSTVSSCSGPQAGWGLSNTGPFSNILTTYYWSASEFAPNTTLAWAFSNGGGRQSSIAKTHNYYAWAVHTGDVGASAVPVPAAAWLFGSGLIGLLGVARRRH